jgi:hypothetical protein
MLNVVEAPGASVTGSDGTRNSSNTVAAEVMLTLLTDPGAVPVLEIWNCTEEDAPTAVEEKLTVPLLATVVETPEIKYA